MSFDERFLDGPPVPDRGREYRALPELRWCGKTGKLQQAWIPFYGGMIEWRDVPTVYSTADGD